MIILATIPVGLVGLAFEHEFRVLFGKPIRAAIFLLVNGVIMHAGETFRSRASLKADAELSESRERASGPGEHGVSSGPGGAGERGGRGERGTGYGQAERVAASHASGQRAVRQLEHSRALRADERLASAGYLQAVVIGCAQILALLAGISRDGVTMVAGMARGLSREDAARFAFLLATPVILAAGVLKIPDLTGNLAKGIQGQIVVGSVLSGIGAYLSVRFLVKYFQTRTLTPFAIYCTVAGLASLAYLTLT